MFLLAVSLRVDFCVRLFVGRELLHEESSWRDRFEGVVCDETGESFCRRRVHGEIGLKASFATKRERAFAGGEFMERSV